MLKIIFTTCFPWRFSREPQKWRSPVLNNQDEPRTCAVTSDKVKFYFRFTSAAQERLLLKVPILCRSGVQPVTSHGQFDRAPEGDTFLLKIVIFRA